MTTVPYSADPAAGRAPRRRRRWLASIGIILLTALLVIAACAVTIVHRIDRVATALDQTTRSAESLFDTLLTDPAAADVQLAEVRSSLDEAQKEFDSFPMPQLAWVPGLRDDWAVADQTLAVADSLVDDVAPTLIAVATVVDLETGQLRDPRENGWGSTFSSVGDIATQGADALDSLCAAADTLDGFDLTTVLDAVARPVDDLRVSLREACDTASEYGPVLGALNSGGELLDQLTDSIRDGLSGLDDAVRDALG